MRFLYFCLLFLAVLAISILSFSAHASQKSQFCPECTNDSIATQRALAFTPAVQCNWPNGMPELPIPDDLVCHSTNLDVLLVNPLTGDLFAYRLRFEQSLHRHILETRTISFDERQAAQTTVDIYQELITAEFGSGFSRSSDTSGLLFSNKTESSRNSQECTDQPTALDYALNPALRQSLIDELNNQWVQILSRFNNPNARVSRTRGISASFGGISLAIGWSRSPSPLDDVFFAGFRFDVSEVPINSTALSDVIAFRINDAQMMDLAFTMNIEFAPELSRAAGVYLNQLLSGQTVVDHPCVIAKLAEFDQDNPDIEFRIGGPGGPGFVFPEFPFPSSSVVGGFPVCNRRVCVSTCVDDVCTGCQYTILVVTPC